MEGTSLLRVPAPVARGTVAGGTARQASAGDEGSGVRDQGPGNGNQGTGDRGQGTGGAGGATKLAAAYRSAEPFPHIHLTDFLDTATLDVVIHEFPAADATTWTSFRHFNENKAANSRLDALPPATRKLVAELQAPPFLAWLEELTGFRGLVPDETLAGCGLHASTRGGFLNVHADFLAHHYRPPHPNPPPQGGRELFNWRRRVNLIVYLNEGWQEEWGGALELWDRSMRRCVVRIPPLANHAVIFNTTETAYHGHPEPLTCPEGVQRKSLALSYYTIEPPGTVPATSTHYRRGTLALAAAKD